MAAILVDLPRRERVVDAIVDLILDGVVRPGEATSERIIAEKLEGAGFLGQYPDDGRSGLSRTPVREALALMVRDGMFDQVPQVGVRLRPVTVEEVQEVTMLRGPLELLIVRRFAAAQPQPSTKPLDSVIKDSSAAMKQGDAKDFSRADLQFHCALARVAGFRTAEVSLRSWISRVRVFTAGVHLDEDLAEQEVRTQNAIVDCIARHDVESAAAKLLENLTTSFIRVTAGVTDGPMRLLPPGFPQYPFTGVT